MDKQVVFAVAGSGKTQMITDKIDLDSKYLILTYTIPNAKNIQSRIIKKLKMIPKGVKIYTYFSFLYSFCYKPLVQCEQPLKGINWSNNVSQLTRGKKKDSLDYYVDKHQKVYANRLSKLLIEANFVPDIASRIEKYFDLLFIDEVQDFAANDFNFICELSKKLTIEQKYVGDFYQHTYDTSSDGNTNKTLHDDYQKYKDKFIKAGLRIDTTSLIASWRCSKSICRFVTENLKIDIESHREDETEIKFIDEIEQAIDIYQNQSIVKLFYNNSIKFKGNTENWGKSKGLDHYMDVCVVLNPNTLKYYLAKNLHELPAETRNKLYVACTRAKGNLYFIDNKLLLKAYNSLYR
ncbi:UvrD-helicase domain-containing protein [Morganella morganii]|uniref:UvrD-helicase domain-containing protein n=1 Tax=Morganella morganii TaxID=582 RepID=UPI003CFBE294